MAITYNLAPNPKWYIADKSGLPLGGGYMATYRALNPGQQKLVFQDQAGMFPWPYVNIPNTANQGILFDMNGSQGPFYFQFDTANPQETYYLEIYDSQGVLQWTINNFTPPGGSGGSIINSAVDLENLIVNNVMSRNIGSTANPIPSTFTFLAPGAHSRFALTPSNAGPDIAFVKNNTNALDQITFVPFTLGLTPLLPDVTPTEYCNYVCANSPSGETFKYFQFPITANVQNLSGSQCTFTIWAFGNTNATLSLQIYQFFGDNGGSVVPATTLQTFTLTSGWAKYPVTAVIPSVAGKTIGTCFNDGLFLLVGMPLGVPCNIGFTKPAMYTGTVSPNQDYHTYDMTDGIINAPRTGDVVISFNYSGNNYIPGGWVPMQDGTIGNSSSNGSIRAANDTFPLFNMLWNGTANQNCQLYNSSGTPISRGGTSIADYVANNALALPKALGRSFAQTFAPTANSFTPYPGGSNTGFVWGLAVSTGWELHSPQASELIPHTHTLSIPVTTTGSPPGLSTIDVSSNTPVSAVPITTASAGSGGAFDIQQPIVYANYLIKL